MRLVDSHCHLQDQAFAGELPGVLARARSAGVEAIVDCGFDLASSVSAIRMAEDDDILVAAAGIHPHDARDVTAAMLAELESLAALQAVAAVGEIGLDFYRELSPRATQREVLARQLEIAVRLGKPVSVHSRGAEDEIYGPLAEYAAASPLTREGRPAGVMHCFGGTVEQALRFVALGFLVSVACSVTYPGAAETRRMAAALPLDRLLVETDSPYLPPQALRGKRNEPALVGAAVQAIAAARGQAPGIVAEATAMNAAGLFGLKLPRLAASS
jgi:TatD DNase family protein